MPRILPFSTERTKHHPFHLYPQQRTLRDSTLFPSLRQVPILRPSNVNRFYKAAPRFKDGLNLPTRTLLRGFISNDNNTSRGDGSDGNNESNKRTIIIRS